MYIFHDIFAPCGLGTQHGDPFNERHLTFYMYNCFDAFHADKYLVNEVCSVINSNDIFTSYCLPVFFFWYLFLQNNKLRKVTKNTTCYIVHSATNQYYLTNPLFPEEWVFSSKPLQK